MPYALAASTVLIAMLAWSPAAARAEVKTPSFPCSAARKPVEVTICVTPDLAALDTAMAALYETLEESLDRRARERLERDQRLWRANRDRCGGDAECIARAYDDRIEGLMDEVVPGRARRGGGGGVTAAAVARLREELDAERRARDEAEEARRATRERAERLEREVAELRAALDGLGRRPPRDERPRASRESVRQVEGYCADFVSGNRVAEVRCRGEFVERCRRGESCLTTGRFALPGAREVTVRQQGDSVALNGAVAARLSEACYAERGGLYTFCFSARPGARPPGARLSPETGPPRRAR